MVLILSDSDVARSCTASRAIAVIRKAIHAHGEGRLAAPPRSHSSMTRGSLVYTAGALDGLVHGVRVYDRADSEQVVAVWDSTTGRLAAVVLGHELGRRRTGAIGAVAIDTLARSNASTLGVVGTGNQAWAQVWAATSVRAWRSIAVFSRNAYVRERFAARCREQLLVDAVAVNSAESAVRSKDAVIVATDSATPVFDTSWLDPGTHISTLGPKTISAHEVPLDLLDRVDVLVTDSLAQIHGYTEPYALSTRRMVELGAVITGALPGRTDPEQITVFCSVGLAGTEVVLAADLSGLPTGPAPAMTAAIPVVALTPQVKEFEPAGAEAVVALADPTAEPTPPNGFTLSTESDAEAEAVAQPSAKDEPAAPAGEEGETAEGTETTTSKEAEATPIDAAAATEEVAADDVPTAEDRKTAEPAAEDADDIGLDIVLDDGHDGGEARRAGEPAESSLDDSAEAAESDGRTDDKVEVVTVRAESEEKRAARDRPRSSTKRLPKPRNRT